MECSKDKKDADVPDCPKISCALPVMKWVEAFSEFLKQVIGVRMVPLFYVIHATANVDAVPPTLAPDQLHSNEYGSVENEMTFRASHEHPLFREDNQKVYFYLEEGTRGTVYAATIKPYQRRRHGRDAFLAIQSQYAGKDKWEAEIKRCELVLHKREWTGQNSYKLESLIAAH